MTLYIDKPCVTLAACRANTGMSQQAFAKALGITRETLRKWEKGITTPSYKKLEEISQMSGVPVALIF